MASTQYSSTVTYVFATENDVNGGSSGFGDVLQEPTLGPLLKALGAFGNRAISGFELPSSGSASDRVIGSNGRARIGGYLVGAGAAGFTVSFPYSTSHVWLRLLRDGASKVTAAVIEVTDTATAQPEDGLHLGHVTTAGGSITGAYDGRPSGRIACGVVSSVGTALFVASGGTGDWGVSGLAGYGNTARVDFDPPFYRLPIVIDTGYVWEAASESRIELPDMGLGVEAPFAVLAI